MAWNEGGSETRIALPLNDGWYVPDDNPFAIPNGQPSNRDNPEALYLVRYQNRQFSGPLGRGYDWDVGYRVRVVYAVVNWSCGSGVALADASASLAPQVRVPQEKLVEVADPQTLRADAVQLTRIAETLMQRFQNDAQAQTEIIQPILQKAARFIELAEAIERVRGQSSL